MEETIVQLETAKLAKEKGFNLCCYHHYDGDELKAHYQENGSSTDVEFRVDLEDLLESWNQEYLVGTYSAPTQSLLQKCNRGIFQTNN